MIIANLTVHQSIVIHNFRVNSITSSSVLQIGSAGIIKPLSNLYNTGAFTGPAPESGQPQQLQGPFVPLAPPT
ncbi:spore germination protein GerPB [Aneurinibacillus danicus]|jgi:spore germination protein PB|uniref:spore germination protein GerPB n=1 Tax=Aneurinibacillus danicus TaxID=267746 RepID=UPI0011BD52A1|nr:spore germination protein GerPB [Aneurinibacillus danicus]